MANQKHGHSAERVSDLSIFNTFEQNSRKKKSAVNMRSGQEYAVGYTRVSSKEQFLHNGSLETQRKMIDGLSLSKKVPIIEYFGGTYESAKSDERKEYLRMLDYIKKSKLNIKYIFVSDLDRFSRTGWNAMKTAEELEASGISVMAASTPIDSTSLAGSLMRDFMFIYANMNNKDRKEKCSRGMLNKYQQGIFFGHVPMGYEKTGKGKEIFYVPNEQGRLIAKAFRWKAENKYTSIEIVNQLKRLGLNISDKKLSWIFRNVFYCGILKNNMLEEPIEGINWEPIVSKELFLKANGVLKMNREKYKNRKQSEAIPLRHIVYCNKCEKPMTGYLVKKKDLYYYKCNTKGCGSNKSAKQMHDGFEQLLDSYGIDEKYVSVIKKRLKMALVNYDASLAERQHDISKRKTDLVAKIDSLDEKFIENKISQELYDKFSLKYNTELAEINAEMPQKKNHLSNLENLADEAIEKTQNLSQYWVSAGLHDKQRIQKAIFPSKLYYDTKNGTYRTTKVNEVLALIANFTRETAVKKQKSPSKKSKDSHMVEVTGFEPVTLCL